MNGLKFIPGFYGISNKYTICSKILEYLKVRAHCTNPTVTLKNEKEDYLFSKIIYNEVLQKFAVKRKARPLTETKPAFLKFLHKDENKLDSNTEANNNIEEQDETLNFPYEVKQTFLKEIREINACTNESPQTVNDFTAPDNVNALEWDSTNFHLNWSNLENPEKWVHNDVAELQKSDVNTFKFGTADSNIKPSNVPCGGCGALLHCNDPSLPGFIPVELFKECTNKTLREELCQRCHFLRLYNVSLGVNISPAEYIQILKKIKEKEALVILMIDLLDFPCSIFPGILDIIGHNKPIVIVGNKVDLLIQESSSFLENFKNSLFLSLKKENINLMNVKCISLISAKTGYGVEKLISKLHLNWENQGDVYLVGCTNVGKSTLFNTLIQSDYCKVKAVDLMQRATVSTWPGTTLNLLKFPIMALNKSKVIAREKRLKAQKLEEEALQTAQLMWHKVKMEQIPLQGHVGQTFAPQPQPSEPLEENKFLNEEKRKGINPSACIFKLGHWCYDTPGVIHRDQIINILSTPELLLTIPRSMLLPRNFKMQPGMSLFIAGLARLDYISGADFVWFTVFASMELPLTVTKIEDADYVYKKLLGSSLFRVPMKGPRRLAKWPKLSSKKFDIYGNEYARNIPKNITGKAADVDIVLSSAGWVSVCVPPSFRCKLEAWTPEGRGIYLRNCPLILKGFEFKGKQIQKTSAFEINTKEIKGYSLTDEPPY